MLTQVSQETFLAEAEKCEAKPHAQVLKPFDAAVILASWHLTGSVEDAKFIVSLLRLTSGVGTPPEETTVLVGVVEGIPSPEGGEAREGVSVLQGYSAELLPGLWEGVRQRAQHPGKREETKAALVFRVPELGSGQDGGVLGKSKEGLEVGVPLANTVFQNGRLSTMFVTRLRWEAESWVKVQAVESADVTSQVVRVLADKKEEAGVRVPLLPITLARTVKSALGNILKQVEIDGQAAPASKELEEVVPLLLERRRRKGLPDIQGPLGVWALVVPARLAGRWHPGLVHEMDLQPMLRAGCRLHKVLSGGGGWGAKQGLLSLDPEAKMSTTDEEDVESFERDFMAGREGGEGGGSVVGPGDEVMFCVDTTTFPAATEKQGWGEEDRRSKRFVVEVAPETAPGPVGNAVEKSRTKRMDGFFGLVTTAMFVAPIAGLESEMAASMKIDTPGAELFIASPDETK